ncbi:hypothetical protein EMK97_01170 [Litorilituus sediminis]|uniref:Uncharacterized protein n=2 Tax=Litorilituus sediminis TaxID=718192 RepID=A0A4P6P0M0_9GAMM|nr:hypothetical protein EMK97_01170 [Litorilituus sediminis]
MEYYPPKGTSFAIRLLKMVIFVAMVFVLSKLLFELNQLNHYPAFLNDTAFVFLCLTIGWFFRIKNTWEYSEQDLIISADANLFGFVFIAAKLSGVNKYEFRLWNPDYHSFAVNSDFIINICFKPTDKVAVGGCHVLCNNQEIKPN